MYKCTFFVQPGSDPGPQYDGVRVHLSSNPAMTQARLNAARALGIQIPNDTPTTPVAMQQTPQCFWKQPGLNITQQRLPEGITCIKKDGFYIINVDPCSKAFNEQVKQLLEGSIGAKSAYGNDKLLKKTENEEVYELGLQSSSAAAKIIHQICLAISNNTPERGFS